MAYKFNKEKFLISELGGTLKDIVITLSDIRYKMDLCRNYKGSFLMEMTELTREYNILLPQLEIILFVLKQFYNLNCKWDYSVLDDVFEEKDFFVYIDNEDKEILFVDDYYKYNMRKSARKMFD